MTGSKKHRIVMVSLDAVGKKDMDFMLTLPNFSGIVRNGFFSSDVSSVYPSLTYPAHTAIVTGRFPNNTGIVNNTRFEPSRTNPDWLYKRKFIHGNTLIDEAHRNGYSIAAFLWPVMGGAPIDYNIPEVLVTRKYQTQVGACLLNGSPKFILEINRTFGKMRDGVNQPALDDFLMASVKYTIDKYDPDMLLIHLTDVDTTRHNNGAGNDKVTEALKRHDRRLGELIEWLSAKRPMEDTTLIVLGDHCQTDTHTIVYPNKFLLDRGLIYVRGGRITGYKAIAKGCDGSAYIYINPAYRNDSGVLQEITDAVNEMKRDESLGIEAVFTGAEADEMGADGSCLVMLEGKKGYYFLNEFDVLTEAVENTGNHKLYASHGYLPSKEENKTFFAAMGRGIKEGSSIASMRLVDEGPTIARLMDWNLGAVDGKIIKEMLK